jgi:hypothetical protein
MVRRNDATIYSATTLRVSRSRKKPDPRKTNLGPTDSRPFLRWSGRET